MDRQIVLAHYQEDISWVHSSEIPTLIYHKGNDLPNSPHQVIPLNNTPFGREGHTYLYHIVRNYDSLANTTFFLQGDPFPHISNLQPLLNPTNEVIPLVDTYDPIQFRHSCNKRTRIKCNSVVLSLGLTPMHSINQVIWQLAFPTEAPPKNYLIYANGANFAVPSSRIRMRPRAFYQRLLELCEASEPYMDVLMQPGYLPYLCPAIHAWALEVLWLYVFRPDWKTVSLLRGPWIREPF